MASCIWCARSILISSRAQMSGEVFFFSERHYFLSGALQTLWDVCCAPLVFLSLRTTQHDSRSATQRGADYAKVLETCRCRYHSQIGIRTGSGTGSVQIPLQFGSGTGFFRKCEWYLSESGSKTTQDVCLSVRPSVCLSVTVYSFLNNS